MSTQDKVEAIRISGISEIDMAYLTFLENVANDKNNPQNIETAISKINEWFNEL